MQRQGEKVFIYWLSVIVKLVCNWLKTNGQSLSLNVTPLVNSHLSKVINEMFSCIFIMRISLKTKVTLKSYKYEV